MMKVFGIFNQIYFNLSPVFLSKKYIFDKSLIFTKTLLPTLTLASAGAITLYTLLSFSILINISVPNLSMVQNLWWPLLKQQKLEVQ